MTGNRVETGEDYVNLVLSNLKVERKRTPPLSRRELFNDLIERTELARNSIDKLCQSTHINKADGSAFRAFSTGNFYTYWETPGKLLLGGRALLGAIIGANWWGGSGFFDSQSAPIKKLSCYYDSTKNEQFDIDDHYFKTQQEKARITDIFTPDQLIKPLDDIEIGIRSAVGSYGQQMVDWENQPNSNSRYIHAAAHDSLIFFYHQSRFAAGIIWGDPQDTASDLFDIAKRMTYRSDQKNLLQLLQNPD